MDRHRAQHGGDQAGGPEAVRAQGGAAGLPAVHPARPQRRRVGPERGPDRGQRRDPAGAPDPGAAGRAGGPRRPSTRDAGCHGGGASAGGDGRAAPARRRGARADPVRRRGQEGARAHVSRGVAAGTRLRRHRARAARPAGAGGGHGRARRRSASTSRPWSRRSPPTWPGEPYGQRSARRTVTACPRPLSSSRAGWSAPAPSAGSSRRARRRSPATTRSRPAPAPP